MLQRKLKVYGPVKKFRGPPLETFYRMISAGNIAAYAAGGHMVLYRLPVILRWAGIGLVGCGLVLSITAQRELGANWVPGIGIRQGHKLVTSGLYARIRHPLYSGVGITGVGIIVSTGDLFASLAIIFLLGSLLMRVQSEEMLLRQRFKRRYDQYRAETGMLLPRMKRKHTIP